MAKYKKLLCGLTLFLGFFINTITAEAKPSSLTDLGYFHWANQSVTPADNTFIMHYNDHLSVTQIEGEAYNSFVEVNRKTNRSQALLKNVGFYKGQEVSLLITLERNRDNLDGGSIYYTKEDFLRIYTYGEMIVTYDFLDKNGEPLFLETTLNYYGLNQNKYIGFLSPESLIKGLYANNPTNVMYDVWDGGPDNYWVYFKNPIGGGVWAVDPKQSFEITTKTVSSIKFVVHNNDATTSSIKYSTNFLANPEFPSVYGVHSTFEKANQEVYLKAQQTIPNIENWGKKHAMSVVFDLKKVFETKQYSFKNLKVINFNGEDVSELFNIEKVNGDNITVKINDFNDPRLYDTVLFYCLNLDWIGESFPVDDHYVENGKLSLPFKVRTFLDNQQIGKESGESLVNYLGKVTISLMDEKDNTLRAPLVKEGIVTTAFDISSEYPQIDGYTPLRGSKEDKGVFLPDEQLIVHRYRKGQPLHFELLNKENPLMVSRFNNQREISIEYSYDQPQEKSISFSLIAKYKDDEKVLKKYSSVSQKGNDQIVLEFPEQWIGQEVSFYLKDNNGRESNMETRIIKKEKSPIISLPEEISFGEVSIPSEDEVVFPTIKEKVTIENYSKVDQGHWKIKVKEEQPLKNEELKVLSQRLLLKSDGTDLVVNRADQEIWQGSGSASFDLSKDLGLMIHPSDSAGAYRGTLCWTLEDSP